ncbi:MAG: glutathione S-transferase family protein [Burkholderiaceae bacterium]
MKLHDRETSTYSYKARLLLGFLGLPYERIAVARRPDGRNEVDAGYLRLNPRGQIPTLEDGGVVLWGSTAILTYLALRHDPARRWLPADPCRHSEIVQWLELAQNELRGGLFLTRAISRFGYRGDLAAARDAGVGALRLLEGRLGANDWLAGDTPTIADIACFPDVAFSQGIEFGLTDFPGVEAWSDRFKRLPGFVASANLA